MSKRQRVRERERAERVSWERVVFVVALLVLLGRTLPLPLARPHSSRVRCELKIE